MIEWGVRLDSKDLTRFQGRLRRCGTYIQKESENALRESAELYYLILIEHMGESRGDEMVFADTFWPRLSKKWLDIKKKHGWTEEIWEATGTTKGAIKVSGIQTKGNTISIFVGLKDVSPKILMDAMENEFGVAGLGSTGKIGISMHNIPARPLFEPAKREIIRSSHYRGLILASFRRAVKAALGNF